MAGLSKQFKKRDALIDISEDQTTSQAIDIRGWTLFLFEFPSAFTGAAISFLCSTERDGTYLALQDDADNLVTITVPTTLPRAVAVTDSAKALALASCNWVKIVSASNEAADRTIGLIATGDRP